MQSFRRSGINPPGGREELALPAPEYVDHVVLAAGAAKTYPVPAGGRKVVFETTGDFWIRYGNASLAAAAIPSADVSNGSGCEFMPDTRSVPSAITHFSLIAASATTVTLLWYGD